MKKSKILLSLMIAVCFSFGCIGYAAVSDELSVTGTVTVDPPPKTIDYLYVSNASIVGKGTSDVVHTMSGSSDYTQQRGWVSLTLDFTKSTTRTVEVELTNLSIANLAFYRIECSGAAATVDPADLVAGEYNEETALVEVDEEYVSDNEANQTTNACIIVGNGGKRSGITVTLTSDTASVQNVVVSFLYGPFTKAAQEEIIGGAAISSALEMLRLALNNDSIKYNFTDSKHNGKTFFDAIVDEMSENGAASWGQDYVGNVVGAGAGSTDSNLIKDIFGDTLNSISLGEEEPKECTVMLKHEDITHANTERFDRNWFGSYRAVNPIEEMTLYMTTTVPSEVANGAKIDVWAAVFYKDRNTGVWSQYGDVYRGTATTNSYEGGTGNTSFDTGTWRSSVAQTFAVVLDNGTTPNYTVSNNVDIKTAIRSYEAVSGSNPHYARGTP